MIENALSRFIGVYRYMHYNDSARIVVRGGRAWLGDRRPATGRQHHSVYNK